MFRRFPIRRAASRARACQSGKAKDSWHSRRKRAWRREQHVPIRVWNRRDPGWSPDGSRIAFATQRTAPRGALWTAQFDGSQVTKLFEDEGGRFPIAPTWSPDAQHVLFALDPTNDQFTHPVNGLYVIKADGTGLTLVSGTADFKGQPEWWR